MKVLSYRRFGEPPQVIDAQVVIVQAENGDPIVLACEQNDPRVIVTAHVKDKDFNRLLRALGLDKTVICDEMEAAPPPAGARLLSRPGGL